MILDVLENWRRYQGIHPAFAAAFEFLQRPDLAEMPQGRHEIDGDRSYAMIASTSGKGRDEAVLEAHRRYIDIQFTISGCDEIGWAHTPGCTGDGNGYDAIKDIEFFRDRPETWAIVRPGMFSVLFPTDAHAPLAGAGPLHKVVMKIKAES
jgi:biofilm protein TabA